MGLLHINGLSIPIAVGSLSSGHDYRDELSTNTKGESVVDRSSTSRTWDFETIPLRAEAALWLRDFIAGDTERCSFDGTVTTATGRIFSGDLVSDYGQSRWALRSLKIPALSTDTLSLNLARQFGLTALFWYWSAADGSSWHLHCASWSFDDFGSPTFQKKVTSAGAVHPPRLTSALPFKLEWNQTGASQRESTFVIGGNGGSEVWVADLLLIRRSMNGIDGSASGSTGDTTRIRDSWLSSIAQTAVQFGNAPRVRIYGDAVSPSAGGYVTASTEALGDAKSSSVLRGVVDGSFRTSLHVVSCSLEECQTLTQVNTSTPSDPDGVATELVVGWLGKRISTPWMYAGDPNGGTVAKTLGTPTLVARNFIVGSMAATIAAPFTGSDWAWSDTSVAFSGTKGVVGAEALDDGRVAVVCQNGETFICDSGTLTASVVGDWVDTGLFDELPMIRMGDGYIWSMDWYLGAAVFHPVSLTWAGVSRPGSWGTDPVYYWRAVRMADGNVFLCGGSTDPYPYPSHNWAFQYTWSTSSWSALASMSTARIHHQATVLADGKILVSGGWTGDFDTGSTTGACEIYNPATNTWSAAASMSTIREGHSSKLLANGKVLVAGGRGASGALSTAELYDPSLDSWSPAGDCGELGETQFGKTRLFNWSGGHVAYAPDTLAPGTTPKVIKLYNPTTNTWSAGPSTDVEHNVGSTACGMFVEISSTAVFAVGPTWSPTVAGEKAS